MKKFVSLLLLGFLTVSVLLPSVVNAEENQNTQEPSLSVYTDPKQNSYLPTNLSSELAFDKYYVNTVTLEKDDSVNFRYKINYPAPAPGYPTLKRIVAINPMPNYSTRADYRCQIEYTLPGVDPNPHFDLTFYDSMYESHETFNSIYNHYNGGTGWADITFTNLDDEVTSFQIGFRYVNSVNAHGVPGVLFN